MRHILILLLLSLSCRLHAQDEVLSLKVVKKNPIRESRPDTVKPTPMYILETGTSARINQSFSRHGWGAEIGALLRLANIKYIPSLELQYSYVKGNFDLSGYEHNKPVTHEQVEKAQTEMSFIKMPLIYTWGNWAGTNFSSYIETGITPSYLLQVKNRFSNINVGNMHRFNCAYTIGGGIHLATNLRLGLRFSGDILSNLQDNSVYNEAGAVIGKQNSRKYLLGFSASYRLGRHYIFANRNSR